LYVTFRRLARSFYGRGIHTGFGDEWVRIARKQYATAPSQNERMLSQPYIGIPNNYVGLQLSSREQLYETGRKAHEAAGNWPPMPMATSDRPISSESTSNSEGIAKKRPAFPDRALHFAYGCLIHRMQALRVIPRRFPLRVLSW